MDFSFYQADNSRLFTLSIFHAPPSFTIFIRKVCLKSDFFPFGAANNTFNVALFPLMTALVVVTCQFSSKSCASIK